MAAGRLIALAAVAFVLGACGPYLFRDRLADHLRGARLYKAYSALSFDPVWHSDA
jgi:hypothetical protein